MFRQCICIGVLILMSMPLKSQQDNGDIEPLSGETFQDCDECPEMVVVPSGSFTMGSPSGEYGRDDGEGPRHLVTIDYPLAVGVYEVTFSEWDACVADGGCGGYGSR